MGNGSSETTTNQLFLHSRYFAALPHRWVSLREAEVSVCSPPRACVGQRSHETMSEDGEPGTGGEGCEGLGTTKKAVAEGRRWVVIM